MPPILRAAAVAAAAACALAAPALADPVRTGIAVPVGIADPVPVGIADLPVPAPHHAATLDAVVWYPAFPGAPGAPAEEWGANPVFHGHPVHRDAPPAAAPGAPVALLSHGLGGNLRGLGWLAHALAGRGAVVVALDHPGSTTRDMDPGRGLDHGTRARDLSAALDALAADPRFARATGPVTAAGFSFGGWTALSLAGMRGSLAGYADHCDAVGARSAHCADIAGWGVDLRALDAARWDASYADRRIERVVAIDPGPIWGLRRGAARDVDAAVLLIGLGAGADRHFATDMDLSGLAALLPDATRAQVAPARHWSALPACRPGGAAIVAEETDLPICADPPGADRGAIHAEIAALVAHHALAPR